MAYDRADWHYGGDFAKSLPQENGGTHFGMFLAWAISRGLEGDFHRENSSTSLEAVRARRMAGREFLFRECDEKFWDEDLGEEGTAFVQSYYDGEAVVPSIRRVLHFLFGPKQLRYGLEWNEVV